MRFTGGACGFQFNHSLPISLQPTIGRPPAEKGIRTKMLVKIAAKMLVIAWT